MSSLMDRLPRWADNLPATETIPITETETEELVAALVPLPARSAVRRKIAADLKAREQLGFKL